MKEGMGNIEAGVVVGVANEIETFPMDEVEKIS